MCSSDGAVDRERENLNIDGWLTNMQGKKQKGWLILPVVLCIPLLIAACLVWGRYGEQILRLIRVAAKLVVIR